MYKGIFWCYIVFIDDDLYWANVISVKVHCDLSGNILNNLEYASKLTESLDYKTEWEKLKESEEVCRQHQFDYYPRGRVEIENGRIIVYANAQLLKEEKAKKQIIKDFELEKYIDLISWIADDLLCYECFSEEAVNIQIQDDYEIDKNTKFG